MPFDYITELLEKNNKKIVLLVMDGLGGLPMEAGGKTELEAAHSPNMDRLAAEGTLGQTIPVRPGVTPGSGPAHLSLFGYDPIEYKIGRGALEACGVGENIKAGDIAVRCNFCTLDRDGKITDRRAGRIPTEEALPIIEKLKTIQVPGVEVTVRHVKEYRFAIVMRGEGLSPEIDDTDPQDTGVEPLPITAIDPKADKTAALFRQWSDQARKILSDEPKANFFTMRGFATDPGLPPFPEVFGLRAACVAVYPMYKGVSDLVGMDVIKFEGEYPTDEFAAVKRVWEDYDFFFIHIKKTDSMGEDGNFDGKAKVIESVDQALPELLALKPDVVMITGDHSTPSRMRSHSWHPVPFLLWSPALGLADNQDHFGERACQLGGLGTFHATQTIPLGLAHAGKLLKYGA
ncbi:MAG: 2,3-bisphosphoglycerate-independent phosphoglycerate mutase [Anaerolineales bacterium]|nr:2,3-bisphosphoglycerate-independent phosphoglycerate mutase [Anaerolineales bacterium]